MYKPCYELNIDIEDSFKTRVLEIFDEIKEGHRKYLQPEALKSEHPELWEPLGPMADWFSPKVRIINHLTEDLGTAAIHLDVNEHEQYEDVSKDAITQCALNIPFFEPIGDITRWWRQKNPEYITPYDFWIGDGHNLATHKTNNEKFEMEVIDEFEIKRKPVLFRVGIWHNCVQPNPVIRCMLSFHAHYTIDWDTFVNIFKDANLLIDRD